MTLAEIIRAVDSKKRLQKMNAQDRAYMDYTLADLIGRSVSRIYSSSSTMPTIAEVYPSLFDSEEIEKEKQKKRDEMSILRFKQFAQSHNKQYEKEVGNDE